MIATSFPASPVTQVFGDAHLHTDGELLAVTFGLDGTLWSVEDPGVLRRWNPATGEQRGWHALSELETLWAFSDDALILGSASNDLSFWDTASGQLLTTVPQPSWVTALAFHPEPGFVATGHDDGMVRYWDGSGHRLLREFRLHKRPISALAISRDGKYLASAGEDKWIGIWQLAEGKHVGTLKGHSDRIPALAWHPHSSLLASAAWDGSVRVWDIRALQPAHLLAGHANQVNALVFSPDGRLLVCGDSDQAVHVWSLADKKTVHVLKGHHADIRALAFSPDGRRLAVTGNRLLHLWDPIRGQALVGSGEQPVVDTHVSIHPAGTHLATNGGGTGARIWHTVTRKVVATLGEDQVVHAVAYSPDGRWIAGAAEKHVRLWDATTGESLGVLEGPEEPITHLVFTPDSSILAAASSTGLAVWLWRVSDGEPVLIIPDALDGCGVEALAFHADGRHLAVGGIDWLATGGSDGAVCVWDIMEQCEVRTFPGGSVALAVHPSGRFLASGSLEESICIWGWQNQELHHELLGHDGTVRAVSYSPDGRWLASGSDDRTLRLWDEAGEEIGLLEVDSQIKSLCFSADGRFLFTGNGNTTSFKIPLDRLLSR
jgi:WD40 repeat protein